MAVATQREGAVACNQCRTPILQVVRGEVLIKSHHHGQNHESRITLQQLLDMMKAEGLQ